MSIDISMTKEKVSSVVLYYYTLNSPNKNVWRIIKITIL